MENGNHDSENAGRGARGQQEASGASPQMMGQGQASGNSPDRQMPFLPRRPEDAPAKATQMKAVIILLVCILIVNLAALVLQFLPMGMRAAGPGMMANGNFPLGGNPPTNQQQG